MDAKAMIADFMAAANINSNFEVIRPNYSHWHSNDCPSHVADNPTYNSFTVVGVTTQTDHLGTYDTPFHPDFIVVTDFGLAYQVAPYTGSNFSLCLITTGPGTRESEQEDFYKYYHYDYSLDDDKITRLLEDAIEAIGIDPLHAQLFASDLRDDLFSFRAGYRAAYKASKGAYRGVRDPDFLKNFDAWAARPRTRTTPRTSPSKLVQKRSDVIPNWPTT